MTTVKVQKNQIIAKQKEKVKKWYIVQEGTVIQCNSYAKIVLGKNAVCLLYTSPSPRDA